MSMIVALTMSISCFTGCSLLTKEPKDASELLAMSQEVMNEIGTNYTMKMTMSIDALLSAAGGEEGPVRIELPIDMVINTDLAGTYMHGTVDIDGEVSYTMSFDGEKMTENKKMDENVEIYYVMDGTKFDMYTKTGDSDKWIVTDEDLGKTISNLDANTILNVNELFATAEMVDKEDSYTVTVKLVDMMKHDEFKKTFSSVMGNIDAGFTISEDDVAAVFGDASMVYTFDREYHLVKCATGDIKFDIMPLIEKTIRDTATAQTAEGDNMSATLEEIAGMDVDLTMNISMEFGKFGEIDEATVKVSDDIIKNAVSEPIVDDDLVDDPDNNDKNDNDEHVVPEANGISTNWKDLDIKVDGVLYQFPYDYDELVDNGWSMDLAEYGYEDGYTLNKGDMTYSTIELTHANYGTDWDSFTIWCGFANYTDKTIDITQGNLWAIELDIMDGLEIREKYPTVYISNGITWGATQEDIIKAFGEPTSAYESDESEYVVLEYMFDYDIYMELTVYNEFGLTCIDLSSYM
jgi:hypothetical protein